MKMKQWQQVFLALVSLLIIFISVKQYSTSKVTDTCTHYNNYIIFKKSPSHLLQGTNLYEGYEKEHYDVFKYTPTFALLFSPFLSVPDVIGLSAWNLLNALVWLFALFRLQNQSNRFFIFGLVIGVLELYISILNSQSNALIAGLLLWAYIYLEKEDFSRASLFIWLTTAIKLFGIVFFAMFVFYKGWHKKGIVYAILWGFILFFIPTVVISFKALFWQYSNYLDLLKADQSAFLKYSFLGWLQAWFSWEPNRTLAVLFALVFQFGLSIYKSMNQQKNTKLLMAASWLLWMVIFNHMSESATFIIALTGVVVWWEYSKIPIKIKGFLIVPIILFTCLGPSDIYPKAWRMIIVADLQLKVFPCILIYAALIWELLRQSLTKKGGDLEISI
jgi:hypothetical protein